jgi:hypothetical protein
MSDNNFIDFFDYIMNFRYRFMKFYFNKIYLSKNREIVPFVKGDENIFTAESRLPGNLGAGVGITGLYCLILFGVSLLVLHFKLNRKIKDEDRVEFDLLEELEQVICSAHSLLIPLK